MATFTNTVSNKYGWDSTITVDYTLTASSDNSYCMSGTITVKYKEATTTHSSTVYQRVAMSWNYDSTWSGVSNNGSAYTNGSVYDPSFEYDYQLCNYSYSTSNYGYTSYQTKTKNFTIYLPRRSNGSLWWALTIWNMDVNTAGYTTFKNIEIPIAKHRITYNANGGSGAPADQVADYNKVIGITTTKPTRTNRTFLGWSTSSSGTPIAARAPGSSFPENAPSEILYAVWSPELYDLTIWRTGGSGVSDPTNMGMLLRMQFYIGDFTDYTIKVGSTVIPKQDNAGNGTRNLTIGSQYLDTTNFDPTKDYTVSVTATNAKGSRTVSAKLSKTAYFKPTVTSASAYRYTSNWETPVDDGSHPAMTAKFSVYTTSNVTYKFRIYDDENVVIYDGETHSGVSSTSGRLYSYRGAIVVDPEKYYTYEITLADELYTTVRRVVIDTAFMAMDILGDLLWYQPSTDTAVVSGKKYFEKVTSDDGDTYVKVDPEEGSNPQALELYERSGTRPASGVAFGTSAEGSGFRVAMPTRFEQGVTAYNAYDYDDPRYATMDEQGIVYHGSNGADQRIIRFYDNTWDAYGNAIVLGACDDGNVGGSVMIGAGECAQDIDELQNVTASTETLFLASDGEVRLYPTWGNEAQIRAVQSGYTTNMNFLAGTNNDVSIGTSSNNGVNANTGLGNIYFMDSNATWGGQFGSRTNASGNGIYTYMGARNFTTSGTEVTNYIQAIANKDGTKTYSISDKSAFRKAVDGLGGEKGSTSYYGVVLPDGSETGWLRAPSSGLLPNSADSTNGVSGIGTSTWPFANGYFKKINGVTVGSSPKFTDTHGSITSSDQTGTSSAVSVAANSTASISATCTVPSGYVFSDITSMSTDQNASCGIMAYTYSQGTLTCRVRNFTSSAKSTTVTFKARFIQVSS